MNFINKNTNNLIKASGVFGIYSFCYYNRTKVYDLIVPALNKLDPEISHDILNIFLSNNIYFKYPEYSSKKLNVNIFDKVVKNPVGLAAGFDKNADMYKALNEFGFGYLELGSVVKNKQIGNQKPRIYKYENSKSIVNNMGLNSKGLDYFHKNIATRNKNSVIGINLAKNNSTINPISDINYLISRLDRYADYLVINFSCPNVNNNYNLYSIEQLLKSVKNNTCNNILIKISPEINYYELVNIINLSLKYKIYGLIISNTQKTFLGGLSGSPIKDLSDNLIKESYKLSNGKLKIIGSGGIMCAEDAYKKIKLGANLVQVYSGFIFEGPKLIYNINKDLENLIESDNLDSINDAVGKDVNLEISWEEYINNFYKYYKDMYKYYL